MRTNDTHEKGDALADRLFFLLRSQLPVQAVIPLRSSVFEVRCAGVRYILKGYSYQKMQQQALFLQELYTTGFRHTPQLCLFPSGQYFIHCAGRYWLLYEYIEHQELFGFQSEENRRAALAVIKQYATHAAAVPAYIQQYVPPLNWLQKWMDRTNRFRSYFPVIADQLGHTLAATFLYWADEALRQLQLPSRWSETACLLHGDIIEHNFVKGDRLYIIDFDCISIGPPSYDYVKFCSCILPHIQWSYHTLCRYEALQPLLEDRNVLTALLFPGDVLREWDYFLSLPTPQQERFREPLLAFTRDQYHERFAFTEQLYRLLTPV